MRLHAKALLFSGLLLLLLAPLAAPAQTDEPKVILKSFGSTGSFGGQFALEFKTMGLAVNRSGAGGVGAGDLYVLDTGNRRIQRFDKLGNFISAFGIDVVQGGATGTGNLTEGSTSVSSVTTTSKAFAIGQTITGAGIAAETTITAVGAGAITLSKAATATGSSVALSVAEGADNIATNERQLITLTGAPTGGTFTLKFTIPNPSPSEATATEVPFNASAAEVQAKLEGLANIGAGNVAVTGASGGPWTVEFKGPRFADTDVSQLTATSALTPSGGASVTTTTAGASASELCTVAASCKAAAADSGLAGAVPATLGGIATDQVTGVIYTTHPSQKRVDIFSATGAFQGAFGWGVDTGAAALEFCTAASTCQLGLGGNQGGQMGTGNTTPRGIAVSPLNGNVLIANASNLRVDEFDLTLNGSDEVTGVAFVKAFGWDVITNGSPSDPSSVTTHQICTVTADCKAGTAGAGAGQLSGAAGNFNGMELAIDSTGAVYVLTSPEGSCNATTLICRVQKFTAAGAVIGEFAPAQLRVTTGTLRAQAIAVDPLTDHVFVAKHVTSPKYEVHEFDSAGTFVAALPASPSEELKNGGTVAGPLAVGPEERAYFSAPIDALVYILGPAPAPPAPVILPVTDVTTNSAKFHGEVTVATLEGVGFETKYRFEYSANGSKWTPAPVPDVSLGKVPGTHTVEQAVFGLDPNTEYVVRLAATSSTTVRSDIAEFTTGASKPTLDQVFSENLSSTEVLLGAEIDANSLPSTYHFEWGTEAGVYPNRLPAFERQIGSGSSAVVAQESLAGLSPESTYHFRVIAKNAAGTTISDDQQLLTLNAGGLPADRGIEMVSPINKRPVGNVEELFVAQVFYWPAEEGGAVSYPIFNGLESSTAGGPVVYAAFRSDAGWTGTQVSSPSLLPTPSPGANFSAESSHVRYFSPDLKCALVETHNPLTADTPAVSVANGVDNLYRWSAADNSYTLITNRPPLNPVDTNIEESYYHVAGATPDCSRIFFYSRTYSFIPGGSRIYEWDDGLLRDAARRPDGSIAPFPPEPNPEVLPVPGERIGVQRYTVPPSGDRLFFTAISNEEKDEGKAAVFVRKGPTETVNASYPADDSLNSSLGATYEGASPDGSHVFFLANKGLTSVPSNGPVENCGKLFDLAGNPVGNGVEVACDLYDYDVEAETLTNVSANTDPANPKGAMVQGVLDISEDGSTVYFAARGQLVPGEGNTYQENVSGSMFANVYRYHEGQLSYVDTVSNGTLKQKVAQSNIIHNPGFWAAQTTRDGKYLLFGSEDNLDGKNPANVFQIYLYSAETDRTVCVSCPKGRDPVKPGDLRSQFSESRPGPASNHTPRSLSEDGRVFFSSLDPLVPGAIIGSGENSFEQNEERTNLYEWHRGQLSLLAKGRVKFMDSSADGTDVYVRTYEQLVPHDIDFAPDLYDIRIGSPGFAPPVPEIPCDPGADQCQGAPTAPPAAPNPASSGFSGAGNPPPPAVKKQKAKKKQKKRKNKQRKQRAKAKGNRAANANRGGAK